MSTDDFLSSLGNIADQDQSLSSLKAYAGALATYYKGLVESGMPAEAAALATREFQWLQVHKAIFNEPPRVMPK